MLTKSFSGIWQCLGKSIIGKTKGNVCPALCAALPKKQNLNYSTCPAGMKVTICGAAGCTGQPLALLLKQCPLLDEIALFDTCPTCGFGMELSHVDTKCKVSSFSGRHMLCDALKDSRIVVIVARDRCDSFKTNAPVVSEIALRICDICPTAFTIVATEPVESLVPLVAEIQRLRAVYNPRALLGCVELHCVRANTIMADFLRVPPESVRVPVIGGATPNTMVPVLSAAVLPSLMSREQIECVTSCIMSGTEAVCAAKGCSTATPCLAGAFAIARTTVNVVKGMQGRNMVQCAYVDSLGQCAPDCQFFANEIVLGPSGIEKNKGIPDLTKFENCLLMHCLPFVRNEIWRAVWLVYSMCSNTCGYPCPCPPCPCPPCPRSSCSVRCCYEPWEPPCQPPVNWTCSCCPDDCKDEYLASICRSMTCKCCDTALCWKPRQVDYDAARAANLEHQLPVKGKYCIPSNLPKSVRLAQNHPRKNPCKDNVEKTKA